MVMCLVRPESCKMSPHLSVSFTDLLWSPSLCFKLSLEICLSLVTAVLSVCGFVWRFFFVCTTRCLFMRTLWLDILKSYMEILTDVKEYEDFLYPSSSPKWKRSSPKTSLYPMLSLFLSGTCLLETPINLYLCTNCIGNPARRLRAAQQGSPCRSWRGGVARSFIVPSWVRPPQRMSMSGDGGRAAWTPSFTLLGAQPFTWVIFIRLAPVSGLIYISAFKSALFCQHRCICTINFASLSCGF